MDTADTCTLLEKVAQLKKINDDNAKNLLKLGIDMNALPSNLESLIKEIIDTEKATGIHDMNLIHLELWQFDKKAEVHNLELDILKPLQRKVKNITEDVEREEKKVKALNESINDFKREMIADKEFLDRTHEIGIVIANAEKAITETPLPPVELDCDNLIDQVNLLNEEKKLRSKKNLRKN